MEETRNIYAKLHSIKSAGIKLQRDTKAFNYNYATLNQIQEKFGELLQEQGLVVIHRTIQGFVTTEIHDIESKESVSSEIEMTPGIKPQDKGSEITYYRRYNLLSLLDLEVEDDDGKKAQDSQPKKDTDDLPWIADENIDKLSDLISDGQKFSMKDIKKKYKVSRANATRLESMGVK